MGGHAAGTGDQAGHQHLALGRVEEPGAQARVPVLQEGVNVLYGQGQELADTLWVRVQNEGLITCVEKIVLY